MYVMNYIVGQTWLESLQQFMLLRYRRLWMHKTHKNVTLSAKPEVHNVSQRHQRRTEPQSHSTYAYNLVKFGHVAVEICEQTDKQIDRQTDRQTDTLITIPRTPPRRRSNNDDKNDSF